VPVFLVRFYSLSYLIIQCLVGGLYFFLGIFVLLKKPGDRAALVFHWVAVAVAVMVETTWASYVIEPFGLGHAIQVLDLTANTAIPVLFVHFGFVFPTDKMTAMRKLLPALYLVSIGFLLWMTVTFLFATFPASVTGYHRFLTSFDLFRWFFSACIVLGVANFLHSYFTAIEEMERRKLRWVILGLAVGPLGFILLWVIPYILLGRALVAADIIVLISAIAPVTFAISIVRYHVMDIDLILNRGTVYAIVLGALFTIYALVVGTVAGLVGTFTVRVSLIASGVAATIAALLFEPTRRAVQRFVDRTFFRIKYNYREAQRHFLKAMTDCVDAQGLADLIVSRTNALLRVEQIGFFSLEGPDRRPVLVAHHNGELFLAPGVPEQLKQLLPRSQITRGLDDKIEPGAPHESADLERFRDLGIALLLAILSERSEMQGFLAVGPKKSGARFSIEDIDLLQSMVTQAGLALARITLRQKLVLERAETRRLEELNRLKSYFVSSVSHDLKTPLTSIKMFTELLQTQPEIGPEQAGEYLEIIGGESERLTALIDNVLDFAKVERGVKEYHFAEVKLNELVQTVLKSLHYQFKMQQFQVHANLSPAESVIRADADAVTESLMNLLSNAMKYSPEKREVAVSTFIRDGFAGIKVEDQGIGIYQADLEHIFEPFYRAQEETARRLAGAGLGLALVKHTMEAHKGRVEVRSALGKGSAFTLLFPTEVDRETDSDR
ncbi:MAG: sensor histidine kinase, partial [Candidatus Neomarinimicrobiota bacterium]